MVFDCLRVQANFPAEKLRLVDRDGTRLVWDEHGGTFVLRVEGLEVLEAPVLEGEADIQLEVALPEAETLAQGLEDFARGHGLRLGAAPAGEELTEALLLAACRLPERKLFIFCEAPRLRARLIEPRLVELAVTGAFRSRRVPCQETDLVLHLDPPAMSRVLAGMLAWTRKGL